VEVIQCTETTVGNQVDVCRQRFMIGSQLINAKYSFDIYRHTHAATVSSSHIEVRNLELSGLSLHFESDAIS
jgi:hypothetical protein